MRGEEMVNIMQYFGYKLSFIKGSHFHFQKSGKPVIIMPVHQNKVSKYYIKNLAVRLRKELNLLNNEKIQIHFIHSPRHQ